MTKNEIILTTDNVAKALDIPIALLKRTMFFHKAPPLPERKNSRYQWTIKLVKEYAKFLGKTEGFDERLKRVLKVRAL